MVLLKNLNILNLLIFFSLILGADVKKSKIILSTSSKQRMLKTQASVIENVKKYLSQIARTKRQSVEKFLHECEKEHNKAMENVIKYISNPLNGYTLIKRLSSGLSSVENVLNKTAYTRTEKMLYPKPVDLEIARWSVLNLVSTYDLNVTQLANGILKSNFSYSGDIFTEVVTPMTSSDCYELAITTSYVNKDFGLSLKWATEALRKYDTGCQSGCTFVKKDILKLIFNICKQAGDLNVTRYWWHKVSNFTKNNKNTAEYDILFFHFKNIYDLQSQYVTTLKKKEVDSSLKNDDDSYGSFSLCPGGQVVQQRLFCQYRYGANPFLRLARFKVELLHLDPDITMFHDIISDDEIKIVKKLSVQKFTDAKTYTDSPTDELSVRMGQTVFLPDEWSTTVKEITRRVLDMNNLDPKNTEMEDLQVAYYGTGGFYRPHYDTLIDASPQDPRSLLRRFTTLFYLSEGNQGGATIFCRLGLTVFPRKNSAIFWSNVLSDGRADERTIHAACPVLHGSKWVATKWILLEKEVCSTSP